MVGMGVGIAYLRCPVIMGVGGVGVQGMSVAFRIPTTLQDNGKDETFPAFLSYN